jgi:hypothetical protein
MKLLSENTVVRLVRELRGVEVDLPENLRGTIVHVFPVGPTRQILFPARPTRQTAAYEVEFCDELGRGLLATVLADDVVSDEPEPHHPMAGTEINQYDNEPRNRVHPPKPDPALWGWFGESWGAGICEYLPHVETPDGEVCPACSTSIRPSSQGLSLPRMLAGGGVDTLSVHVACLPKVMARALNLGPVKP